MCANYDTTNLDIRCQNNHGERPQREHAWDQVWGCLFHLSKTVHRKMESLGSDSAPCWWRWTRKKSVALRVATIPSGENGEMLSDLGFFKSNFNPVSCSTCQHTPPHVTYNWTKHCNRHLRSHFLMYSPLRFKKRIQCHLRNKHKSKHRCQCLKRNEPQPDHTVLPSNQNWRHHPFQMHQNWVKQFNFKKQLLGWSMSMSRLKQHYAHDIEMCS